MIGVGLSLPVIAGRAGDPLPGLSLGGALFDPARDERFYQTDSGILLSGAADPVGLMLDDKFGGALGPERLANGTFDTDLTGWQARSSATVTWEAGRARVDVTGTGGGIETNQTIALIVGRRYRITGSVEDDTFGGLLALDVGTVLVQAFDVSAGFFSASFVAAATNPKIELRRTTADTGVFFVDNISVREILGAHASQATTGNRPTRVLTGDVWGLEFDGTSDRLEGDAAMRDIFRNCDAGFFACVVEPLAMTSAWFASWSRGGSNVQARFALRFLDDGALQSAVRRSDSDGVSNATTATGIVQVNQKAIVMMVANYSAGTVQIYANNPVSTAATGVMAAGSGPSQDTRSDAVSIGSLSDGTSFLNGRLHGPIVIGRIAPSAAQRQAIFSRLSAITGAPLS
jgi:hypothetical protein